MPERTQIRLRSLALFVAPVAMLVAIIFHPFLVDELDVAAAAAAIIADPTRWAWVYIMLMAAFALILLAVVGCNRTKVRIVSQTRERYKKRSLYDLSRTY